MIDLTLLGCGGNVPIPNRFLSSLFINYNGRKILIDCGEGTQVSLKVNKCGFKDIDLICITHLHGDHIFGLPGILSTIGNSGKTEDLTILGPSGIIDAVKYMKSLLGVLPYNVKVVENPEVNFKLSDPNFKNLEISTIDLEHSVECIGYSFKFNRSREFDMDKAFYNDVPRFMWRKLQNGETMIINDKTYTPEMVLGNERIGIKLSFITDTRPVFEIPDFIKDSDLLVCEAMYGDDLDIDKAVKNKHMTFRESANLARLGNASQLLLTHFSPSVMKPEIFIDNAKDVFENTIVGEDGLKLSLKYK
ncbi:ribonuclease Z [Metaclostridioides mangenotii]|uniref:Ribonuclease Z n=1 Tax=Metaclostridioides mangenotii TaxID=1540 RepID=A0ABS4EE28_9FIRM|nr:ribonuclease Z [Clostridioides mangenotii]MBP1856203.1 ribonuclease Z [Clostridioides mangenotii]